jgi:hypothetical protein
MTGDVTVYCNNPDQTCGSTLGLEFVCTGPLVEGWEGESFLFWWVQFKKKSCLSLETERNVCQVYLFVVSHFNYTIYF